MMLRSVPNPVRSLRVLLNVLAVLSLLVVPASQAATPLYPPDAGGKLEPSQFQRGGAA